MAECLYNAEYPLLYYCKSTLLKSDKTFTKADAKHIMKMKHHFINKDFYFQKVPKENTELTIINLQYDADIQIQ